jgi:isocitrate dehydrogenase
MKQKKTSVSVHLKATMMKVSTIFEQSLKYFASVLKNTLLFTELGVDTRNGLGDVYAKPGPEQAAVGRNQPSN